MEVKVAQGFVLNFLFNKLPRRRVNLFGEELESALLDKFADHWYPDKPFKGSAFRCLRITDPNDPVLQRAARESGNPVSDIIENLPADLAIWIDPGEVSYRIGEKGTVKILYSESNDSSGYGSPGISPGSGGGQPMANPQPQLMLQQLHSTCSSSSSATSSSGGCGTADDLGPLDLGPGPNSSGFLNASNLDTLNSVLSALSVNCNSSGVSGSPPMASVSGPPTSSSASSSPSSGCVMPMPMPPPPPPPPPPQAPNCLLAAQQQQQQQQAPPPSVGGSGAGLNINSGSGCSGFSPFQPRAQQQPITYTAGTFAQTKFGSTKLKTNGKKTNRMSPTEFSNYIKQRAMQKQQHVGVSQPAAQHFGRSMSTSATVGFRPLPNANGNSSVCNGFYNHHQQQMHHVNSQPSLTNRNSFNQRGDPFCFTGTERMGGASSGFYTGGGSFNQGLGSFGGGVAASRQPPQHMMSCDSGSSGGSPWSSCVDSDAEAFLQDILTVGLSSGGSGGGGKQTRGGNSNNLGMDFGGELGAGGSTNNLNGFGLGGLGGGSGGGLFGDQFGGNGIGGSSFVDHLDHVGASAMGKRVIGDRSGSSVATSSAGDKYHQRVLVAN